MRGGARRPGSGGPGKGEAPPAPRVWVEAGCTVCKACEKSCPQVFRVDPDTARVRRGADPAPVWRSVRRAAAECPVQVIRTEPAGEL